MDTRTAFLEELTVWSSRGRTGPRPSPTRHALTLSDLTALEMSEAEDRGDPSGIHNSIGDPATDAAAAAMRRVRNPCIYRGSPLPNAIK